MKKTIIHQSEISPQKRNYSATSKPKWNNVPRLENLKREWKEKIRCLQCPQKLLVAYFKLSWGALVGARYSPRITCSFQALN